jgi:hypothetical protein
MNQKIIPVIHPEKTGTLVHQKGSGFQGLEAFRKGLKKLPPQVPKLIFVIP